jgi:uncharacterized protein (TIGR02186 family)
VRRALLALARISFMLALATLPAHAQQQTQAAPAAETTQPATGPGGVAADLPAAVTQEQISVSSDYRGSVVTVFGFNPDRRGRGDIVVVVRGPNLPATVMRKRRFLGLWVNGPPVRFSEAPSFFAVMSNRPLSQIATPQAIWSLGLDPAASAQLSSAVPPGADPSDYRAALVRLRRAQGLYQQLGRSGLRSYTGGLFLATVRLPANAPIDRYQAETYLFRDQRLISSQRTMIQVERVGIERNIHELAMNSSTLYGLLVVLLALGAGAVAAYLFRRQ